MNKERSRRQNIWKMSNLLEDAKNPSFEDLQLGKSSTIIRDRASRYRATSYLDKRAGFVHKLLQTQLLIQRKIQVAYFIQKAALQFIDDLVPRGYKLIDEFTYDEADELASMVRNHDTNSLASRGGAEGIAEQVSVSLSEGVRSSELRFRRNKHGENRYAAARSFLTFFWEALQDAILSIFTICAVVSIGAGVATEGFPKGMYDGMGILLSIILVVMVTAMNDYNKSLQFRDLDREMKKIITQVTRDGSRQEISTHDLVVGDVVHLSPGNQVPADGIFISGDDLEIDESCLSGKSEPSYVNKEKPFLFTGTEVLNGSAKMLVAAVGMRTEWGALMETLSEGGEDETPLQVKLNGVSTRIGWGFAVLMFVVLCIRFVIEKANDGSITKWSSEDALKLLAYFALTMVCEQYRVKNSKRFKGTRRNNIGNYNDVLQIIIS